MIRGIMPTPKTSQEINSEVYAFFYTEVRAWKDYLDSTGTTTVI